MKVLSIFSIAKKSNITTHTLTNILLTFFAVIQVVLNARFLGTEKLAIIAVFYILISIIEHLFEFGFNKALIQKQKLERDHVNVVFFITIIKGAIISLIIYLFASDFEYFFGVEGLSEVLVILSLTPFIKSIRNTYAVILQRSLNFELYGKWMISSSAFKVICIFIGLSLYPEAITIAYALVIAELFSTSLSYAYVPMRPSIKFSYKHLLPLWNYGKWVFLAAIVAIFERQGAQVITLKLMSAIELSMLYIAMQFIKVPAFISNTIKGFLFPNFSRSMSDSKKIKEYYNIGFYILLLSFGYFLFISIFFGEQLIVQLLGSEWGGIGALFGFILLSKAFDSFSGLDISLLNGIGHPRYVFITHAARATSIVLFCPFFIMSYGLIGVGLSYIASSVISWALLRYLTSKKVPRIYTIPVTHILSIISILIAALIVCGNWNIQILNKEGIQFLILNIIFLSCVYFSIIYLVSCIINKKVISSKYIRKRLEEIKEL